jgi:hypothetical protein
MTWDEIRTRVGQEAAKHIDLALYRIGGPTWKRGLDSKSASDPRFFFSENNVAQRAALLRAHLPAEAENILQEADNICRHEFRLLGYDKLDYGRDIDWHSDPVHGKRSPLKPWFKINFLDFHTVGDHKIVWELNRHQHLVTLAKAWRLTGRRVYCDELVAQWYSWKKSNPYPLGVNWASTLEVAFRSMSWLWARNLLAGCADLSAGFEPDLLITLQAHGRYIERYLSTYFSPNTHLLGEAVALFFLGTLCPEIMAAERWRNKGWEVILAEADRQVRPDGVYFEQALYYHVYAFDFFLHARLLASLNGNPIPEQFDNVLKKMLRVVAALSEVGAVEGFGDDDGGRVFNPRRNQAHHLTDPLAIGSILYDCNDYTASVLSEEAVWLFGEKAIDFFAKPRPQTRPRSQAFESGGIYLINDHEPLAQQMMIDAGPQGIGHSGHGHADALSIRFAVDGRRILVDPGTFCYISDDHSRDSFRGTGAHNTLRVDGVDQAVPDGPFAWSSIPNVKPETWQRGQTFDFFVGRHDGYRRLEEPVLHRRSVFHVKGGLWVIRDGADGQGTHLLEIFWHFASDVEIRDERPLFLIAPAGENVELVNPERVNSESARVALLFDDKSAWKRQITESWISSAYGSKKPAPLLRASVTAALPQECAVLLIPQRHASDIGAFAALDESPINGVCGYRYRTRRTTEFVFFARETAPWTCGLWISDATLLYCKLEAGRLAHVIMIAGSFAEWNRKRFVSQPATVETFEWSNRPGLELDPDAQAGSGALVTDFEFLDSVL